MSIFFPLRFGIIKHAPKRNGVACNKLCSLEYIILCITAALGQFEFLRFKADERSHVNVRGSVTVNRGRMLISFTVVVWCNAVDIYVRITCVVQLVSRYRRYAT